MEVYLLSQPSVAVSFMLQPLYLRQNNEKTNLRLRWESNTDFHVSQPVSSH
jgi:hypothetical protein